MITNLQKGIVPANAVWPVWPWIVGSAALMLVGLVIIAFDVTLQRQKPGTVVASVTEVTSTVSPPA
jgi:hypothetical protein